MTNVTPINATHRARPHVHQLDPQNVAIGWMFRHGHALDRVTAIEQLTVFLMSELDLPERAAEIAAIQAYAETSSVSQVAHIDADATTAHVVVLRTMGGRAVAFTADDLVHVLERARDEGRARVVNSTTRTPVLIEPERSR
ncbi:hypothetical protein [Halomonas urumqiensis]|uniref:Uncharacterized protein n=1 Tax=Halomonas urumqiensis TaxID=1684789 RepID=A0A2N7UDN5_9GAMM|nr:hypothetical protein [Halomonas urumqiensis]PMR78501.1 hypothetical protein C1H70_17315 [Halomonas urumqiensis]PTB03646.1 hypothetical protein C6V82_03945 [Halomonas urumqiensis]